jgi:hypothetical protein
MPPRRRVPPRARGAPGSHRHPRLDLDHLLDRYGARDLDAALADALARGAVAAQSVAHLLDQLSRQRRQRLPLPPHELSDPRARVVVTPHALAPYDKLGRKPGADHE